MQLLTAALRQILRCAKYCLYSSTVENCADRAGDARKLAMLVHSRAGTRSSPYFATPGFSALSNFENRIRGIGRKFRPVHDGMLGFYWGARQRPGYSLKVWENLHDLFTGGGYFRVIVCNMYAYTFLHSDTSINASAR